MLREKIARWLLKSAYGGNQFLVGNQSGIPQYNNWNEEKAIREGYKASAWVYACVRKLADQVASVPLVVWKKVGVRNVQWVRAPEHPLELLLQRPNPRMTGIHMSKAMTTYLNLAGNHYWYIIELEGVPKELWPLRPDRVRPIPSKTEFIKGYQYTLDGVVHHFDVKEISHFRFIDPYHDFLGMSALQAVARIVDTDNESIDWNKNAMENRAVPPGALVADGNLTDEQFKRLKGEVEHKIIGSKHARKPLLLEAGLKWQSFAISPTDMDFIEGRRLNREEICGVFGVPPVLVGIQDKSTYNNYETAKRALWEDTIIPYLDDITAQINLDLTPRFGDNLWIEPDLSEVPALQEKFDNKVVSAQKLWTIGVPFSKINERLELGMDDVPEADIQWVPSNMVPMDQEGHPNTNIPINQDNQQDINDEDNPNDMNDNEPSNNTKSVILTSLKAFNLENDEQKTLYWKTFDQRRELYYDSVSDRVIKRFQEEEKEVIKTLKNSQRDILAVSSVIEDQKEEWSKLLKSIYVAVIQDFGATTFNSFKASPIKYEVKEEAFDVWNQEIQQWIATVVGEKITQITETTLLMVRKVLVEGVVEGESISQLVKRLTSIYKEFSKQRAVIIARTEVISASNAASRFAAKRTGLNLDKEWISTRDKRTRLSHQKLDGEVKGLDESYSNGLMFPGDPFAGKPSETIQCRCTEGYIKK